MTEDDRVFRLLKVFPDADAAFVAYCDLSFAHLGEAAGPELLERRLRQRYPLARVRVQERLGMNGAPRPHWYVFRDGRLVAVAPPAGDAGR